MHDELDTYFLPKSGFWASERYPLVNLKILSRTIITYLRRVLYPTQNNDWNKIE
jgi:hypothetical protein